MLRFLKLKVIVNGKIIYPLEKKKPLIVPLAASRADIVVTDGFHITNPYEVVCTKQGIQQIDIGCFIEDEQLIAGFILLSLFYSASLTSGLLILKFMSFVPIVLFIYLFYIQRRNFLNINLI